MENLKTKDWYWILIKGIIMILLAILVFASPGGTILGIALYIGIGFVLTGVVMIGKGLMERKILPGWGWTVFGGILDLVLGYVLLAHPGLTAAAIPFVLGFWALFYGFFLLIDGFSGTGNAAFKAIAGILVIILANVILFNPILAGMSLMIWFGILLLIGGIYNVIASFSVK